LEVRNLGRSGLRVSAIGLGCNNFGGRIDLDASRLVVHAALDAGITLFDTADAVTVHTPLPSGCQLRGDAGQR